jgi:hypothetical protein
VKFNDIYDLSIKHWPEKIYIRDGYKVGKTGFAFPTLGDIWNEVEQKVGTKNHFCELMVWTMFGVFHKEGRRLLADKKAYLYTRKISKEKIRNLYFKDLNQESWDKELKKYVKDNALPVFIPGSLRAKEVKEIFSKIYLAAEMKELETSHAGTDFSLKEKCPNVGDGSIVIWNMKKQEVAVQVLREILAYREGRSFDYYFLQMEYMKGVRPISYKFHGTHLMELLPFQRKIASLNTVLLDSSFTWALIFHYEGIGLLFGPNNLLNLFRTKLPNRVENVIWMPRIKKPD